MKRLSLLISVLTLLALVASALPFSGAVQTVRAQSGGDLIVLNDTTPGIDVVINPSPDTTGVVGLEIHNASVTVTDAVGNLVFQTTDPALSGLEFSFAPNAGTHTLTISRLPGAGQGYARIAALAEMSTLGITPELVSSSTLSPAQEADFPLNASAPSSVVQFTAPDTAVVTARFPGAPVTAQLVDRSGNRTLATLTGSLIDGVRFTMDGGSYDLVLLNNNTARATVANVSIVPAPASDFASLVAQAEASATTTMVNTAPTSSGADSSTAQGTQCSLSVTASSVNLRSGPGMGYSVLDYAFRGDSLAVGGVNPESGWLLVGTESGSAWISNDVGALAGSCNNLTAYNIPYRPAPTPQVTIQQSQVSVYHDDDDDHDDDDYDDGEYDDDHNDDRNEDYDDDYNENHSEDHD